MRFILLLQFAWLASCASSQILRDSQYQTAVEAYGLKDPDLALKRFPDGERQGFITSVEKAWLGLWTGQTSGKDVFCQANRFDERHFVSLSREAGVFLFQESEEGYVPAEHEVVILHLVSAILYQRMGKTEDAKVELRLAGYVLERTWDDPALRLWLGSLWTALGDWPQAQVDFRRANELATDPRIARLAEGPRPKFLNLHFYGNAPILRWRDGRFTPDFLEEPKPTAQGYSTQRWFERHTRRNNELRDVLVKSNFMAQYLGGQAVTVTERGMGKAMTGAIRLTAIAVGTALVVGVLYLASQSNLSGDGTGYLAAGAAGVGVGIWKMGGDFDRYFTNKVDADEERKNRDLRIYRVMRFLPSWIQVDTDSGPVSERSIEILSQDGTTVRLINHF